MLERAMERWGRRRDSREVAWYRDYRRREERREGGQGWKENGRGLKGMEENEKGREERREERRGGACFPVLTVKNIALIWHMFLFPVRRSCRLLLESVFNGVS